MRVIRAGVIREWKRRVEADATASALREATDSGARQLGRKQMK
jgi:hypothetical protein